MSNAILLVDDDANVLAAHRRTLRQFNIQTAASGPEALNLLSGQTVTELDPQLPLVRCLPGEINQVLLNLVINAAHAIADALPPGEQRRGRITVSTQCFEDMVELRVSDTGTGIPEDVRSRIFEPFFTTKPVGRGTGQGLSLAHAVVVNKHGGQISFDTELGKGTTFIVRLPRDAEPVALAHH